MSKRYGVTLNFLAQNREASWSQIKSAIQVKESHSLTNAAISTLLNTLLKTGFIQKINDKYTIADPLLIRGIKEHPLPE